MILRADTSRFSAEMARAEKAIDGITERALAKERGLRFEAIRRWADQALSDPSLHAIAAEAIEGLAASVRAFGGTMEAQKVSGPERRSERHPGALSTGKEST